MEKVQVDERYSFWNGQLEKLGERDPLEVLGATPARLRESLDAHSEAAWRRAPAPGKWTPLQLASHLLDIEWVFGFRIRTILWDDRPRLMGMDHDAWGDGQKAHDATPAERVESFGFVREANLRLWRRLTAADLARTGVHDDAGLTLELGMLQKIQAGHDLWHLEKLEELLGG